MFYFAYGSNMDESQMVARCPSRQFVGVAVLRGHRLAFPRRSVNRGCGVAGAVESPEHKVWGIVYELLDADVPRLDQSEGYQPGRTSNSYWRRPCTVFLDGSRSIEAETYFAEPQPNPRRPKQAYKSLIVGGARGRLPPDYVAELEQIQADP
jgi:gamma-glutamylcyclotransferase (GGCT)/AIG2-like uncharacterized protein YtfP